MQSVQNPLFVYKYLTLPKTDIFQKLWQFSLLIKYPSNYITRESDKHGIRINILLYATLKKIVT